MNKCKSCGQQNYEYYSGHAKKYLCKGCRKLPDWKNLLGLRVADAKILRLFKRGMKRKDIAKKYKTAAATIGVKINREENRRLCKKWLLELFCSYWGFRMAPNRKQVMFAKAITSLVTPDQLIQAILRCDAGGSLDEMECRSAFASQGSLFVYGYKNYNLEEATNGYMQKPIRTVRYWLGEDIY